ncbi:hypothetical protein IVB69_02930 [Flavobacterium sp. J49]|uniref:toxin-antitoxin system YwqK family antitoxin n=1 Tax=Flavobacterium sp. J49 TaxID=2718534 RepID=UPI0015943BD3|nr:hypothetical protein [Flavobacterium sp. J49]MBF6640427.1 hypothetical protein [Flavobacterium sp. J49]NIC01674.1 hypothetical protein [Flavobacterium sp. J49]
MRYFAILFTILLFFTSCKNEIKEYDAEQKLTKEYTLNDEKQFDGIYKEFYENGNLKVVKHFENGVLIDSIINYNNDKTISQVQFPLKKDSLFCKNYYKNNLESEGVFYQNMKHGKWKYFKTNGVLDKVVEYVNICGNQYTNQGWYFKNGKDTIKEFGNYYNLKLPKSIKKNQLAKFYIYHKPLIALNPDLIFCIGTDVDENFCNLEKTKIDTVYGENNIIPVEIIFRNKGKKNLRGFIKEYYSVKDSSASRLIYVDIPMTVE